MGLRKLDNCAFSTILKHTVTLECSKRNTCILEKTLGHDKYN